MKLTQDLVFMLIGLLSAIYGIFIIILIAHICWRGDYDI